MQLRNWATSSSVTNLDSPPRTSMTRAIIADTSSQSAVKSARPAGRSPNRS